MKPVGPKVEFPQMESRLLEKWQQEKIFQQTLDESRKTGKVFSFYDGPPFANGLPHYGHLLANIIKDIVPRYWTMRGYLVERNFGWDCHGFPVESEIEKKNDLKGFQAIKEYGVAKFNEECRASVKSYAAQWQETIDRIGRWVSWDKQYHTMDQTFMETVWWVFSELYKKELVYQGHKVIAYSPRNATVVSNFEANQNYQEVQDPAITVKLKLKSEDTYALIWTTTPWTLPSNLAIAVNKEVTYCKVKNTENNEVYILAKDRVAAYQNKKSTLLEVTEELSGTELLGLEYEPLFDYYKDHPHSFRILEADYVTTSDGTGIVHQAPAFGEDDFEVCRKNNIDIVDPLDVNACFQDPVKEYAGMFVKDADKHIIKDLKAQNKILKHDTLVHSYPFCDRTDTPLIYRAIPSWYVKVEEHKEQLVKNNKGINWVPGHLRDGRMGKWLENARDWSISRNRFWGTPLPIWECDQDSEHKKIIGSIAELEKLSGEKVEDLHKHFIDDLGWKCSECSGSMKRIQEVFDCWFESGSMPYAQYHYPFENKELFEEKFPADFIAEGLDQTRGWFYTLAILSRSLFDKPAFKNVIVNGIICDETGKKMSKRHRNYTPPIELLDKYGADSVRLYMINSPLLRGENLIFSDRGVKDTTRAVLIPLWNAYSFLSTYADAENWKPSEELVNGKTPTSSHKLDKWMISRLQTLSKNVEENMEAYKLYQVVPQVLGFIDDMTNWYIRLSRRRFWKTETTESTKDEDPFGTLYHVLLQFSKLFAPFAPFISDEIYQGLTNGKHKSSVHLCETPVFQGSLSDQNLEDEMELVSVVTELGRALRAKEKIKTRQPLQSITVVASSQRELGLIKESEDLIQGELNVKEVLYSTEEAKYVDLQFKPNLKALGPRLGKKLGSFRKEISALSSDQIAALVQKLEKGESTELIGESFTKTDFLLDRKPKGELLVGSSQGLTAVLDNNLSEALVSEGLAREVVNRLQNFRKESGLDVSDRIHVSIKGSERLTPILGEYKDYIASEVLAHKFDFEATDDRTWKTQIDIDGETCFVGISK